MRLDGAASPSQMEPRGVAANCHEVHTQMRLDGAASPSQMEPRVRLKVEELCGGVSDHQCTDRDSSLETGEFRDEVWQEELLRTRRTICFLPAVGSLHNGRKSSSLRAGRLRKPCQLHSSRTSTCCTHRLSCSRGTCIDPTWGNTSDGWTRCWTSRACQT